MVVDDVVDVEISTEKPFVFSGLSISLGGRFGGLGGG